MHEDQLREAFETHENMAPDAAAVYARVQELSKSYKWRRRGIQAAGGMVVGAGLIAAVIQLPAILPGDPSAPQQGPAAVAAASPAVTPLTQAEIDALPQADIEKYFKAYYGAGFGYENAQKLSALWKLKNPGDAKVQGGRMILAGETLPIKATPDPVVDEPSLTPEEQARYAAFFNAGYVWDDAVKFAKLWHSKDPGAAKVEAGKRLIAGQALPIKPKPANVAAALDNKRVEKFFTAGYSSEDAAKLAKIWHKKTAYDAKIEGGKRLLAGQPLPIKP